MTKRDYIANLVAVWRASNLAVLACAPGHYELQTKIIAKYGYAEYIRIYKQAYIIYNTKPYTFNDFSAKASKDCADKTYVSNEATHNED